MVKKILNMKSILSAALLPTADVSIQFELDWSILVRVLAVKDCCDNHANEIVKIHKQEV